MKQTDLHPAPVWLTTDYLEKVLRNNKKDDKLKIKKLDIYPATAKGENYVSVMTRMRVEYLSSDKQDIQIGSYIAKTAYENDPVFADIMKSYNVYKTEVLMYAKILPELTQLLKEIGDEDKLFPETIHVDYEHAAIIFEDLAVQNFTLADRFTGMNEAKIKMALRKLAKMHATATVYEERHPNTLRKLDHGLFNRHTRAFGHFYENMLKVCADFAGNCEDLGEYYKEKLLKLSEKVVEYATRTYDDRDGHFLTLAHGDFWVNNIMIRYCSDDPNITNGGTTVEDMILIDFQFSCWTSPAVDLHYFYNTSLPHELRMTRQDEFNQYYYNILTAMLRKLGFTGHIPSLHEFYLQLEARRFFAVTSSFINQAVMINEKNDDADFNNLIGTDEKAKNFQKLVYTNKRLQDRVKDLLPFFDRRGLLDVID